MLLPASQKVVGSGKTGHWTPYIVSSDAEETRKIVGRNVIAHRLEHTSRRTRPVTVSFRSASFGHCTLVDMEYTMFGGGEASIQVPEMTDIFLFEMNLAGEMAVGQRSATTPFRPGEIYMINADMPHAKLWSTDGRQLMLKIYRQDMEAALQRLTGLPLTDPLRFASAPQAAEGVAATLKGMIEVLVADIQRDESAFARPDAAGCEQMILELVLRAMPNNYTHLLSAPIPRVRPRHVRRVAEYIHANSESPIALADLTRAAGVSDRSLQAGFRKYYGVSPMIYLRNVRLDRARLRLMQRGRGDVSVTGVALECGFTHLGKFARAYRDRFAELPSETLRSL